MSIVRQVIKYGNATIDARPRLLVDPNSTPSPASKVESMVFLCCCGHGLCVRKLDTDSKSLIVIFEPHICTE